MKVADIRALCMSLNLAKNSSHLKENKKTFNFLAKFIEACVLYVSVGCDTVY